jgi:hypothetical protein
MGKAFTSVNIATKIPGLPYALEISADFGKTYFHKDMNEALLFLFSTVCLQKPAPFRIFILNLQAFVSSTLTRRFTSDPNPSQSKKQYCTPLQSGS